METLSIMLTTKRKREIHFLHTVHTANCKLWNFSLSLQSIFSAQNSLCVPQCKENEFLSFFSWLTIWRDIQKCYRAHLVTMLSYLARKSQSYFDRFVIGSYSIIKHFPKKMKRKEGYLESRDAISIRSTSCNLGKSINDVTLWKEGS